MSLLFLTIAIPVFVAMAIYMAFIPKIVTAGMLRLDRRGMSRAALAKTTFGLHPIEAFAVAIGRSSVTATTRFTYAGIDRRPQPGEFFLSDGAVMCNSLKRTWGTKHHIMRPVDG